MKCESTIFNRKIIGGVLSCYFCLKIKLKIGQNERLKKRQTKRQVTHTYSCLLNFYDFRVFYETVYI